VNGPQTVAGQAALGATAITFLSLLIAGAGTSGLLYLSAVEARNETLLVAARSGTEPADWHAEGYASPVTIRTRPGRGPSEQPRFYVKDDVQGVELTIETDDAAGREQHVRVYAEAPRVRVLDTVAPFLAPYAGVGFVVATLAGLAQAAGMTRALRPLERAAKDAFRITGLGGGVRLTEDGPREVRAMLVAINALLARLESAFATQARFTAEAAHELRTPVAGLRGEIEVALRRARSEDEYRAVLTAALEEAVRLGALVDGLLALARVDAGQADQWREIEHAAHFALRAAAQEKAALDAAGCSFSVDIRADPEVSAQAPLFVAAIANLLRNAARHAPGSPVSLRVEERAAGQVAYVAYVVDDGGAGVAVNEREEVFGRFTRGAVARSEHRDGLGLGLALAREVARRHGGDCWLESTPAGGCRATLTIRR
jgi:signal transduction histidine kinase